MRGSGSCKRSRVAARTACVWLTATCLCLGSIPRAQPFDLQPWKSSWKTSTAGTGRTLRATLDELLEDFLAVKDHEELAPHEGATDPNFFEPNKDMLISTHEVRMKSKKARRAKLIDGQRRRQNGEAEGAAEGEPQEAQEEEPLEAEQEPVAAAEDEQPVNESAEGKHTEEEVVEAKPSEEKSAEGKPKASVKRKRRSHRRSARMVMDKKPPEIDCKVYILDLKQLAKDEGIPQCNVNNFATHPLTQRLLPNPAVADPNPDTLAELKNGGGEMRWSFPYTSWPHYRSQHAGPWYIQENLKQTKMHTTNISEAHVVLVDDYCYLMWAMADLNAKWHWWLDGGKHYKSNFTAGQHLIDLYHAMAHQREYMHKQGRNFLFITPLTGFDFGDWHIMDNYAGMSCDHFSNSMHIVSDQAQRWRCGRYRPDRTLVAPLASTEILKVPDPEAERDILLYYRGLCDPDGGKDPMFAAKRLRRYMVKVLSEADEPDISVSCTNEDKSGLGPKAIKEHEIRPHAEYMQEMRHSVYCIIIPADAQNTPRLTEAILSGCVPVFLGPPWHAMPYPEVVDWRAVGIHIHFADISRWANFGAKWSLEKNAPRDASRLNPKWWTPQVSPKDTEELDDIEHLPEFLHHYPEEKLREKQAAVARYRSAFVYDKQPQQPPAAADIALQQACRWGAEESTRRHEDI